MTHGKQAATAAEGKQATRPGQKADRSGRHLEGHKNISFSESLGSIHVSHWPTSRPTDIRWSAKDTDPRKLYVLGPDCCSQEMQPRQGSARGARGLNEFVAEVQKIKRTGEQNAPDDY